MHVREPLWLPLRLFLGMNFAFLLDGTPCLAGTLGDS